MLIGPFVYYGLLKHFKRNQRRKDTAPRRVSTIRLEAMDTFVRLNEWGPDPAHPEVLCSQQASDRLELYGQEMIRRHGENFDWRKGPIDPEALHASGGGKAHGWYSMFTGVVDSRDIQIRRGSSSQSSGCTSSRYRRTEQDAVIENLQEALRAQNEYNLRQQEYQRQQQDWIASVLQQ